MKFSELNIEIQQEVRDRLDNQRLNDDYLVELISESAKEYIDEKYGIEVRDIYWDTYRGNYVAFEEKGIDKDKLFSHIPDLDVKTYTNATTNWDMVNIGLKIVHYNSWSTTEIIVEDRSDYDSSEYYDEDSDEELVATLWEDEFDKLAKALEEFKDEMLSDILTYIKNEYDYYFYSEAYLLELIENNDYNEQGDEIYGIAN